MVEVALALEIAPAWYAIIVLFFIMLLQTLLSVKGLTIRSVTGTARTNLKHTTYLVTISAVPMIIFIVLLQVFIIIKMSPAVLTVRVGGAPNEMLDEIPFRLIVPFTGVADPVTRRIAFVLL